MSEHESLPDTAQPTEELHAAAVRDVVEHQRGEVRLPGHRAEAGELGALERNVVVAPRPRVRERVELLARPCRHAARHSTDSYSGPPGASGPLALDWSLRRLSPSTREMTIRDIANVDFEAGRSAHNEGPTPGAAAIVLAGRMVLGSG